jgi:CheY-like chemotaxis protein
MPVKSPDQWQIMCRPKTQVCAADVGMRWTSLPVWMVPATSAEADATVSDARTTGGRPSMDATEPEHQMARLLIVDDNPRVAMALRALFATTSDLQVCGTADSGEAGLVLATTLDPDVVIMDQHMPGIGGVAATRAIKDAGCICRVLMWSGRWTQDQVRAATEAGADAVALKGRSAEELLNAVRLLAHGP